MIELMDAESLQASYVLAIQYLSYRQRSAYEIEQYLLKKEVEPKHIELVMDRLNNEKLLDDLEFAKTFVQERIRQKKKGPDRKSTRLNSSHVAMSYAVFCLKKKKASSSKRLKIGS